MILAPKSELNIRHSSQDNTSIFLPFTIYYWYGRKCAFWVYFQCVKCLLFGIAGRPGLPGKDGLPGINGKDALDVTPEAQELGWY